MIEARRQEDERQRWVNCILVALVVTLFFLLICCSAFCRWFSTQIPCPNYRTAAAAAIIFAVSFLAAAVVFYGGV